MMKTFPSPTYLVEVEVVAQVLGLLGGGAEVVQLFVFGARPTCRLAAQWLASGYAGLLVTYLLLHEVGGVDDFLGQLSVRIFTARNVVVETVGALNRYLFLKQSDLRGI